MHSNIIQVSNKPIAKGEHISIDSVTAGDMASINYAYKTSEERRKLEITDPVGYILPKGMFTVNSDGGDIDLQRRLQRVAQKLP